MDCMGLPFRVLRFAVPQQKTSTAKLPEMVNLSGHNA